jgi:hypothetical protein
MDDKTTWFLPLGYQRLRLLGCLFGDDPRSLNYFEPTPEVDIFEAFRHYVERMSQVWAAESDPLTLFAAARFLTGDLNAAEVILDHLPVEAVKLDHGAGYCLVMAQKVLRASLPLPATLKEINRWLADSAEQAALRIWLAENRDRLSWHEESGVYQFHDI